MVISATNPYFLLWWAVVGLGFVMQAHEQFGPVGVAVYFIGHISADFLWYGMISIVVGTSRQFVREKPYRFVMAILGCTLIFFGGRFVAGALAALA
jgi:threonine/homoserine/homoserine lactone efflux protein